MRALPAAIAAALALTLSPAFAQDQTGEEATEATDPVAEETAEAEPEPPPRPADAAEGGTLQTDLAECSAVLVAMSGVSTSFVERDQLRLSSGAWLSAANRLAGDADMTAAATQRAQEWNGKVQSLRFLGPHKPWLEYCGSLAEAQGLDPTPFTSRVN